MAETMNTQSVTQLIERYHADLEALDAEATRKRQARTAQFEREIAALMSPLNEISITAVVDRRLAEGARQAVYHMKRNHV